MTDENQIADTELHDEDVMEGSVDPKNAEQASIASVDKATDATKKATPPKTKAAMINAMYGKLHSMNKTQLSAAYNGMHSEDVDVDEDMAEIAEAPEVDYNYNGELQSVMESEATLSEEFKEKTAVIFEMALKSTLAEKITSLEENYATELAEEIEQHQSAMVEKVDGYLNYVVENWMEENKVAIQQGLRTEIAEGFMDKLKDVFTESYIAVPEGKVDLLDELSEQVTDLETALNERTTEVLQSHELLENYARNEVIREASVDLVETQVEKLAALVENIDFDDIESFAKKVAIVKETHFSPEAVESPITEDVDVDQPEEIAEKVSDQMAQYLTAIRSQTK